MDISFHPIIISIIKNNGDINFFINQFEQYEIVSYELINIIIKVSVENDFYYILIYILNLLLQVDLYNNTNNENNKNIENNDILINNFLDYTIKNNVSSLKYIKYDFLKYIVSHNKILLFNMIIEYILNHFSNNIIKFIINIEICCINNTTQQQVINLIISNESIKNDNYKNIFFNTLYNYIIESIFCINIFKNNNEFLHILNKNNIYIYVNYDRYDKNLNFEVSNKSISELKKKLTNENLSNITELYKNIPELKIIDIFNNIYKKSYSNIYNNYKIHNYLIIPLNQILFKNYFDLYNSNLINNYDIKNDDYVNLKNDIVKLYDLFDNYKKNIHDLLYTKNDDYVNLKNINNILSKITKKNNDDYVNLKHDIVKLCDLFDNYKNSNESLHKINNELINNFDKNINKINEDFNNKVDIIDFYTKKKFDILYNYINTELHNNINSIDDNHNNLSKYVNNAFKYYNENLNSNINRIDDNHTNLYNYIIQKNDNIIHEKSYNSKNINESYKKLYNIVINNI